MARFSKSALIEYLDLWIDTLERQNRFNSQIGTIQLEDGDVERAIEYGKREALDELRDGILNGYIPENRGI